jgi:hypothetical protein
MVSVNPATRADRAGCLITNHGTHAELSGDLDASIAAAENKNPQLTAEIEAFNNWEVRNLFRSTRKPFCKALISLALRPLRTWLAVALQRLERVSKGTWHEANEKLQHFET